MLKHVEACEWLSGTLHGLEASNIDPCYANMRAVCPFYLLLRKSLKPSKNTDMFYNLHICISLVLRLIRLTFHIIKEVAVIMR